MQYWDIWDKNIYLIKKCGGLLVPLFTFGNAKQAI